MNCVPISQHNWLSKGGPLITLHSIGRVNFFKKSVGAAGELDYVGCDCKPGCKNLARLDSMRRSLLLWDRHVTSEISVGHGNSLLLADHVRILGFEKEVLGESCLLVSYSDSNWQKCQYCEIYIADDVPSRSQHENGLRHKGNKDRFIRGLYKSRVKQQHESEEEKREMQRVEQAAQAAYARDLGAGHATSSSLSTATVPAPAPKAKALPPKAADPYTNYTTAASLGISDPDVERLIEEAKVKKSEGRAGDWVAVVPPPPPLPDINGATVTTAEGVKSEQETVVGEVRRRVEDYSDEDDTRRFKIRRKTASVGLGEIYDPGIIRVKPRVKRDTEGDSTTTIAVATTKQPAASGPVLGGDVAQGGVISEVHDALPKATEMPSWTPREWKWAGGDQDDQNAVL